MVFLSAPCEGSPNSGALLLTVPLIQARTLEASWDSEGWRCPCGSHVSRPGVGVCRCRAQRGACHSTAPRASWLRALGRRMRGFGHRRSSSAFLGWRTEGGNGFCPVRCERGRVRLRGPRTPGARPGSPDAVVQLTGQDGRPRGSFGVRSGSISAASSSLGDPSLSLWCCPQPWPQFVPLAS